MDNSVGIVWSWLQIPDLILGIFKILLIECYASFYSSTNQVSIVYHRLMCFYFHFALSPFPLGLLLECSLYFVYVFVILINSGGYFITLYLVIKHHSDCSNCFSFYICSTFGSVKLGRSMRKWEENKWESFFWGAVGIPDVLLPRWFRIFTGFSVIWRGWLFWSMCFLIDLFYVCCAEFED